MILQMVHLLEKIESVADVGENFCSFSNSIVEMNILKQLKPTSWVNKTGFDSLAIETQHHTTSLVFVLCAF